MHYQDDELSAGVIEAVIHVHRALGPGFLESIYKRALVIELEKRNYQAQREKEISILYDGIEIGVHRLDLLVNEKLIVEVKTVEDLSQAHYAQLRSYLRAANLQVGLLVNMAGFKADYRRVEIKDAK